MPARKRGQEARRAAFRRTSHPDLPGWTVPLIGPVVQTEETWRDRQCPVCGSPQCEQHDWDRE